MTHAFIVDYRKRSTTAGQEVSVPVTVVEVPPMRVVGARLYRREPYGKRVVAEAWAADPIEELGRAMVPHPASSAEGLKSFADTEADDVRLLVHTQPHLITGDRIEDPRDLRGPRLRREVRRTPRLRARASSARSSRSSSWRRKASSSTSSASRRARGSRATRSAGA